MKKVEEPKVERPKEVPFLCWPPGTEPTDKKEWRKFAPVVVWAIDARLARKRLKDSITDADDWEIEMCPKVIP
ncbi:MAG: hypothetical protein A2W25_04260 [candidate division Zixibacteria bacterium RBG_16_53_22]|nr:MAG: hypothetical protein A2W25_04260 [candidate division Zixibacteria bacterium RBG_16_53_22]